MSPSIASAASPVAEPHALREKRVLVVEDDVDSAALLTTLLEHVGFNAMHVHDGPTGVAMVRAWHPEVVLLDLGLPGMSGYETAVAIRAEAENRGLRIIALTGSGDDESRRRSLAAGCERHLVKGVGLATLLAAIEAGGPPRDN